MESQPIKTIDPVLLKMVTKEAGKRAAELETAQSMGGINYFCVALDLPKGDSALLKEAMKAMNAEVAPDSAERSGGSGHIGKMLISEGEKNICVASYVPKEMCSECENKKWISYIMEKYNGNIISEEDGMILGDIRMENPTNAKTEVRLASLDYLRDLGALPHVESDEESETSLFGDDYCG